ncbi:DoxX family protein [Fulvivirgaceae bacterium BMA12]|uniref:DoxX family protein n=1 Tax=Agaribacillus aureus TaxID=3051825 RepID=A0ABT8KYL5_9BACT|nr:DoxX family protein [Fulvivirgaceae bacterium BMA12]
MTILEKILKYSPMHISLLMIRLWLGSIMLKHSSAYLFGGKMGEFTNFLTGLGFPVPETMAYLSQGAEFITAILIIIGFRFGAIILAFNMAIAVLVAHKLLIFTEGELAFNYLILALTISLLGTGKYGLDQIILNRINQSAG